MSHLRTHNILRLVANQSGSLINAWGILPVSGAVGVLTLQPNSLGAVPYTSMSIADLAPGIPFPCFVRNVSVSAGTVYILA